jgi:hypothetical protein
MRKNGKKIHGYISDEESLRIANEIDNELRTFFNQEVELDEDTNVIAVMSKGLNLFHPYLETIQKKADRHTCKNTQSYGF